MLYLAGGGVFAGTGVQWTNYPIAGVRLVGGPKRKADGGIDLRPPSCPSGRLWRGRLR
jgi:hypothetical protein